MDLVSLLTVFLFFTAIVLIGNTLMLWVAYKTFARTRNQLARFAHDLKPDSNTREWLSNLQSIAANAALATESARGKMIDFNPVLNQFQERFEFVLAKVDTRMERATAEISDRAERVRDAVARPAVQFGVLASTLGTALGFMAETPEDE